MILHLPERSKEFWFGHMEAWTMSISHDSIPPLFPISRLSHRRILLILILISITVVDYRKAGGGEPTSMKYGNDRYRGTRLCAYE
jgi:hypothetical protein